MKKMKQRRIYSLLLAVVMAVCFLGTTAFAQENVPVYTANSANFEITSEMADTGVIAVPLADVDQTFTMTTTHRGADRTYSGSTLRYVIRITDADGNAVDNKVLVGLYDYNHTASIHSSSIPADGAYYGYSVPITSGRVYYFYYQKTSGTTRTLRVNMTISSF